MGGAPVSWSSSAAAVATVDGSGLVLGRGEGTATITATSGSAEGMATITVANPDRAALAAFYNATDGPNWVDNTNWLTDAPLQEWYGANTDGFGRVKGLDLRGRWDSEAREYVSHGLAGEIPPELRDLTSLGSLSLQGNELAGPIPPELGDLANLTSLKLDGNPLEGALPLSLEGLSLIHFWYDSTNLCVPADESFRAWLNAIPNHRSTDVDCGGSTAPGGTARETS